MNWAKEIEQINRERYRVPEGWDTKEKIAEQLQCSPERVNDLLRPGIQAGVFEGKDFSVWDDSRRLAVRVRCYRKVGPIDSAPAKKVQGKTPVEDRVRSAILRRPDLSDAAIAKNINGARTPLVRSVRGKMQDVAKP